MEVISRILKDIFFTLEYQIPKYSFVRDHKSFCFKNHSNIKTIIIHLHPESTLLLEQLCIFSGHPPLQTINSISSHKHINCIISAPPPPHQPSPTAPRDLSSLRRSAPTTSSSSGRSPRMMAVCPSRVTSSRRWTWTPALGFPLER